MHNIIRGDMVEVHFCVDHIVAYLIKDVSLCKHRRRRRRNLSIIRFDEVQLFEQPPKLILMLINQHE